MGRQLKQILMYWESPSHEPVMVMSVAREPLKGVLRAPDMIYYGWYDNVDLEVYYWGFDNIWDWVMQEAANAEIRQ